MISKIKFIEKGSARTYESRFGTMYAMEAVLEDGTKGEVSAQSVDKWSIGDEVEYTKKETEYGVKLSFKRPDTGYGTTKSTTASKPKFDDKQRDAAVAVSYAKDCYIHGKILFDEIEDYAKKFLGIIGNIKDQL